jgi:hypothetical protein
MEKSCTINYVDLVELPDQKGKLLKDKYFDVYMKGIWQGSRRLYKGELEAELNRIAQDKKQLREEVTHPVKKN